MSLIKFYVLNRKQGLNRKIKIPSLLKKYIIINKHLLDNHILHCIFQTNIEQVNTVYEPIRTDRYWTPVTMTCTNLKVSHFLWSEYLIITLTRCTDDWKSRTLRKLLCNTGNMKYCKNRQTEPNKRRQARIPLRHQLG